MPLQGMHPEIPQGAHIPPHIPPSSMPISRSAHQMPPPHSMGMMGSNNPYGPSGPLPPNMGGQMMPGAMRPMGMSSANQKVLSNIQLQQLSAQIKAYRMLSRSMTPPEALISIVQGRKPTAAMLVSLNKGNPAAQQPGMGYQLSGGVPSPAGSSQSAPGSGVTGRESPAQTNISLYPLSPSTGQTPAEGSASQLKPPSHLTQSHSSVASPAPNVTLQPGGELPPQVQVHVGGNCTIHPFGRSMYTCILCTRVKPYYNVGGSGGGSVKKVQE